jgi:peptidoglycan/LPS O-acetylase OafA/YrhL
MPKTRLDKLESIRGLAAVVVVAHHLSREFMPHKWYRLPFVLGPEAVMIFFVLSGFVIYYSSHVNPLDLQLRNYAVKRVRRIYPIFLFAMALGYVCEVISLRGWFVPSWKTLVGNLLMCQGMSIDPFYDGPLWSLAFEWWFYVLFFLVIKLEKTPARRQYWAAAISFIGLLWTLIALNQASLFLLYFIAWWSGAELARQFLDQGRITWAGQRFCLAALGCIGLLSLLLVLPAIRTHQALSPIDPPIIYPRHLLGALLLICVGIAWYKRGFAGFTGTLGNFAILAPISYAIYAIHAPLIEAVDSFSTGRFVLPKIALILLLVLGLGYLLEVQLQSRINRWSNRFLTGRPKPSDRDPAALPHVAAA